MPPERVQTLLSNIYGHQIGESVAREMETLLDRYRGMIPSPRKAGWSESDALLITYPDQLREPGKAPLASLTEFCEERLKGLLSGVHLLPFYPWSSDDGFSVIDYETVAPQYGDWSDVRRLGEHFRLMFDAVVNHASAQSPWFQAFLRDEPDYRDYFIEVHGHPDLSQVVRPRALPLLTEFNVDGIYRKLWTTFSADQIDLNFKNPEVLLEILDVLLLYAERGADFIRLDAIAYLWKEIGTNCIHLPQTHHVVQFLRAALEQPEQA